MWRGNAGELGRVPESTQTVAVYIDLMPYFDGHSYIYIHIYICGGGGGGLIDCGVHVMEGLVESLECLPGQIQLHHQVEVQSVLEEIAKQVLPGSVSAHLCLHHTAPPPLPSLVTGPPSSCSR